jgi:hypothetical protein
MKSRCGLALLLALAAQGPAPAAVHRVSAADTPLLLAADTTISWSGSASLLATVSAPADMVAQLTQNGLVEVFAIHQTSGTYAAIAIVPDDASWAHCVQIECLIGGAIRIPSQEGGSLSAWTPAEQAEGLDNVTWSWSVLEPGTTYRVELLSDGSATAELHLSGLSGSANLSPTGPGHGSFSYLTSPCHGRTCVGQNLAARTRGGEEHDLGNAGFAAFGYWFYWRGQLPNSYVPTAAVDPAICAYPWDYSAQWESPDPAAHPDGCDAIRRHPLGDPRTPLPLRPYYLYADYYAMPGGSDSVIPTGGWVQFLLPWAGGPQYIGQRFTSLGVPPDHGAWGLWLPYAIHGPYAPSSPWGLSWAPVSASGGYAISWYRPRSDGGSPLTAYRVYSGPSPDQLTLLATLPGSQTAFEDPSCAARLCYYNVTAVNALGESPMASVGAAP